MESELDFDIALDRKNLKVSIEPHLMHYSPVHAKHFFTIVRCCMFAAFVLFSVFLV